MFIFVTLCVLFYCVCIAVLHTLDAGLLARSQYPEDPATGHLGTGFSWTPCVCKHMPRWFPRLEVATACFSCSPPDLNFLDPYFIFMYMHYNHCHRATAHLQLNMYYYKRIRNLVWLPFFVITTRVQTFLKNLGATSKLRTSVIFIRRFFPMYDFRFSFSVFQS